MWQFQMEGVALEERCGVGRLGSIPGRKGSEKASRHMKQLSPSAWMRGSGPSRWVQSDHLVPEEDAQPLRPLLARASALWFQVLSA